MWPPLIEVMRQALLPVVCQGTLFLCCYNSVIPSSRLRRWPLPSPGSRRFLGPSMSASGSCTVGPRGCNHKVFCQNGPTSSHWHRGQWQIACGALRRPGKPNPETERNGAPHAHQGRRCDLHPFVVRVLSSQAVCQDSYQNDTQTASGARLENRKQWQAACGRTYIRLRARGDGVPARVKMA